MVSGGPEETLKHAVGLRSIFSPLPTLLCNCRRSRTMDTRSWISPAIAGLDFERIITAPLIEHNIIAVTDLDGVIRHVNDRFCEVSGYDRTALVGQNYHVINSGIHDQAFWASFWQTLQAGQTWHGEICNRNRKGVLYWVESAVFPVEDSSGKVAGYVAIQTDVTKQKLSDILIEAEHQALSAIGSGAHFEAACEIILDFLVLIDPAMGLSILELEDNRLLRHVATRNLSQNYIDAIDGIAIGKSIGSCGAAAFNNELTVVESIATHPNWSEYKHLALADGLKACWSKPICDGEGHVIGTVAIYYPQERGPTERELVLINATAPVISLAHKISKDRDVLVYAKMEAEALAEARRLFIANLNHEFRTPLTHVIGFAELLLAKEEDRDKRESLAAISTAGNDLLQKVEKALDLADSQRPVALKRFDLRRFWMDEGQRILNEALGEEKREIDLELETTRLPVRFSIENLAKSLQHVISNAVRFSRDGDTIGVRIARRDSDWAIIQISDSGPGMTPDLVQRATKAFEVGGNVYLQRKSGIGLGLTVANHLMTQCGGKMEIESVEGQGTTVTLCIPCAR
ncbi:MAG: PAS domain S-box protein [Alphaproteobacteria bacterium]|nr:MAG: PAS domain S-box protein [Alphaproteobacteria bacterium]